MYPNIYDGNGCSQFSKKCDTVLGKVAAFNTQKHFIKQPMFSLSQRSKVYKPNSNTFDYLSFLIFTIDVQSK